METWRVAILLTLTCACSASDASAPQAPAPTTTIERDRLASFQTDSLSYQVRAGSNGYEAAIGVTFTNQSPATAYFQNCAGATGSNVERLTNGQWTLAWSAILPACVSQPIVVQPQATYRMTLTIYAAYPECNCDPKFRTDSVSGVYRIVWNQLYGSYNGGTLAYGSALPFEMRVSNPFVLTAQPR
jgi:hypothetical protein